MIKRITSVFILSLATISFSYAQVSIPQALKRPIELALERSADIQNKELEIEKTEIERKKVVGKFIPRVEATGAYAYLDNNITIDVPAVNLPITGYELFAENAVLKNKANVLHGGITAKSVLFSGMQITNGAKALEQKAKGEAFLLESDKDEIIIDVINSFDMLHYIVVSENLIEDSRKRLLNEKERVNKAIENGLAIPFDREKIKLAELELESKQTQLEGSKQLLLEKIQYLTGLNQSEINQISYSAETLILPGSLNTSDKQELEALQAFKKASEFLVKKEKGTYLPQAALFAGVSYSSLFNGTTNLELNNLPGALPSPQLNLNELTIAPNFMAGVVLKWDLFAGMERNRTVQQANISVKQMDNKLEDSKNKLDLLLQQKLVNYNTMIKEVQLADQKQMVASITLSLATRQYNEGLISISQRLEAENDYVKAHQNKIEHLIAQRKAALEVLITTGKLSDKIIFN